MTSLNLVFSYLRKGLGTDKHGNPAADQQAVTVQLIRVFVLENVKGRFSLDEAHIAHLHCRLIDCYIQRQIIHKVIHKSHNVFKSICGEIFIYTKTYMQI